MARQCGVEDIRSVTTGPLHKRYFFMQLSPARMRSPMQAESVCERLSSCATQGGKAEQTAPPERCFK